MKTIEFDLEKAKSGEYEIVTKNGAPVRIICWNKQDGVFKLVGLVKNSDGYEFCQSYDEHGCAHEGGFTPFDLRLVTDDMPEIDGFTDFDYAVGKEMYGYRCFKKAVVDGDQSVIDDVKRASEQLYKLAEARFVNEQPVEQENDGMCDENKPTKMFIDELRERLELALEKYWRPSDKTGVSVLRYTIQDNVIYDCVSGTEMPICDVVNVVVNALNHRNEYWDERNLTRKPVDSRPSVTLPNIKDVRYEGLKQCDEIDVINKHITNTTLSDEVNTRLNNCGWFVCDKNDIRGLIEYLAEIEKNM